MKQTPRTIFDPDIHHDANPSIDDEFETNILWSAQKSHQEKCRRHIACTPKHELGYVNLATMTLATPKTCVHKMERFDRSPSPTISKHKKFPSTPRIGPPLRVLSVNSKGRPLALNMPQNTNLTQSETFRKLSGSIPRTLYTPSRLPEKQIRKGTQPMTYQLETDKRARSPRKYKLSNLDTAKMLKQHRIIAASQQTDGTSNVELPAPAPLQSQNINIEMNHNNPHGCRLQKQSLDSINSSLNDPSFSHHANKSSDMQQLKLNSEEQGRQAVLRWASRQYSKT